MAKNFLNLEREIDLQIHGVQRTPDRLNLYRATSRHIIIRLSEVKDIERILRAAREKREVTGDGSPVRLLTEFSTETFQARRE